MGLEKERAGMWHLSEKKNFSLKYVSILQIFNDVDRLMAMRDVHFEDKWGFKALGIVVMICEKTYHENI
jgi:hypothetical protein